MNMSRGSPHNDVASSLSDDDYMYDYYLPQIGLVPVGGYNYLDACEITDNYVKPVSEPSASQPLPSSAPPAPTVSTFTKKPFAPVVVVAAQENLARVSLGEAETFALMERISVPDESITKSSIQLKDLPEITEVNVPTLQQQQQQQSVSPPSRTPVPPPRQSSRTGLPPPRPRRVSRDATATNAAAPQQPQQQRQEEEEKQQLEPQQLTQTLIDDKQAKLDAKPASRKRASTQLVQPQQQEQLEERKGRSQSATLRPHQDVTGQYSAPATTIPDWLIKFNVQAIFKAAQKGSEAEVPAPAPAAASRGGSSGEKRSKTSASEGNSDKAGEDWLNPCSRPAHTMITASLRGRGFNDGRSSNSSSSTSSSAHAQSGLGLPRGGGGGGRGTSGGSGSKLIAARRFSGELPSTSSISETSSTITQVTTDGSASYVRQGLHYHYYQHHQQHHQQQKRQTSTGSAPSIHNGFVSIKYAQRSITPLSQRDDYYSHSSNSVSGTDMSASTPQQQRQQQAPSSHLNNFNSDSELSDELGGAHPPGFLPPAAAAAAAALLGPVRRPRHDNFFNVMRMRQVQQQQQQQLNGDVIAAGEGAREGVLLPRGGGAGSIISSGAYHSNILTPKRNRGDGMAEMAHNELQLEQQEQEQQQLSRSVPRTSRTEEWEDQAGVGSEEMEFLEGDNVSKLSGMSLPAETKFVTYTATATTSYY